MASLAFHVWDEDPDAPPAPPPLAAGAVPPRGEATSKAKAARGKHKCSICEEAMNIGNSAYCKLCRQHVEACEKDAKAAGAHKFFEGQRNNLDRLHIMVKDFARNCPSRGARRKRDCMYWARFVEATRSRTVVSRGWEMELMDKFEYVDFMVMRKKMSEEDALESRDQALLKTPADLRDRNGPAGFEERVALLTKEFTRGKTKQSRSGLWRPARRM